MKKTILLLTGLLFIGLPAPALGQQVYIGRVLNLNGQGISDVDVTVSIIGTNPGPVSPTTCASNTGKTDAQGNYSVQSPMPMGGSSCQNPTVSIAYSKTGYVFQSFAKENEIIGIERPVATVSGASFDRERRTVGADMIVSLFGTQLATATQSSTSMNLPTRLAETNVSVRDKAGVEKLASLFYVSPTQINLLVPAGLSDGIGALIIRRDTTLVSGGFIVLGRLNPAFFTANMSGKDVAAGLVQRHKTDGRFLNYEPIAEFDSQQNLFVPRAIDLGAEDDVVYLALFGTGLRYRNADSIVKARIGGMDAQVVYAGSQLVYPGLDQVNILLPRSLAGRGVVDVVVTIEDTIMHFANVVQIKLR